MRRFGCVALVLMPVAALVAIWFFVRAESSTESSPLRVVAPEDSSEPDLARGRLPEPPDPQLLAAALALLGPGDRKAACGPYALYTDVDEPRLLTACTLLASQLDAVYKARYGVEPRGEPMEAIVLFATIDSYRSFARETGVSLGYAGYAIAARGLAVFYHGDQPFQTFLTTLAHELTHLLNRRALGVNLPPWLAEGLADGIGDTASEVGFQPLRGVEGSAPQAKRLRDAYEGHRVGSLEPLVARSRREFDRDVVSFDYEQSALLVRFLLDEPELAAGFKTFLKRLAGGETSASPEDLVASLGVGWDDVDRRFAAWVRASS